MNRWTSRRNPPPGDDERGRRKRDSRGSDAHKAQGAASDRSRHEMFQSPPSSEVPDSHRLREPRSTNRSVGPGKRLTVRELMAQMNAEEAAQADPRRAPAPDDRPTQAHRPIGPGTSPAGASPASTRPAGNDVTQKIPPVAGPPESVDLSDSATERRAIEESRGQDAHSSDTAPVRPAWSPPEAPEDSPTDAGSPEITHVSSEAVDDDPDEWSPLPDDAPTNALRTPSDPIDVEADPGANAHADADVTPGVAADDNDAKPDEFHPEGDRRTPAAASGAAVAGAAAAVGVHGRGRPRPQTTRPTSASSGSTRQKQRSLMRRITLGGRIMVAVACITALVGTGVVWGYVRSLDGNWRNIIALAGDDDGVRKIDAQYGDENYLIVGTDTRAGSNSEVGAGTTADAEGARADTVILVNIPADRGRVVAVSFPRDLQVNRPECALWDNETGNYYEDQQLWAADGVKLNGVYAEGGPQCLTRVVTQMTGLKINRFIAMDFAGFREVVDVIGGVEVCSTVPLYDYELGPILRQPGRHTLNADRALDYVRARNIESEGNGDYGRIKRQQLFMSSLLRSSLSGDVLTNPNKINNIVDTFVRHSFVDNVDTRSLVQLAESMQGIDAGRVTFLTIPTSGTTEDGLYNEIPRLDDIDAIFDAIIDDQPLPGEHDSTPPADPDAANDGDDDTETGTGEEGSPAPAPAPPPETAAAPEEISATAQNPGNVSVRVLNGTGTVGAAATMADQLSMYGFNVTGRADASENRTDTVVRYGPGEQDSAATIASMLPGATIQLDRTVRSGVHVIIGSEFAATPEAAPAVGTTLTVTQLAQATSPANLPNDLAITNAGDSTCT